LFTLSVARINAGEASADANPPTHKHKGKGNREGGQCQRSRAEFR